MQNCFNKYGEKDVYFKILEFCEQDIRIEREKYYIETLEADINVIKDPIYPVSHCKKIYQYDTFGNFIQEYPSLAEAARINNINSANISTAATHHRFCNHSL